MKIPRKIDGYVDPYGGREQTKIKHLILEQYLERVAWNILSRRREFVFVDGFSGPWASNSKDYADTSFGLAMRLLSRVRDQMKLQSGRSCRLRCIFVEKGASAFERLQVAVTAAAAIEAQAIHGRFEDHVDEVKRQIGSAFALVFIDPKGWTFDLRRLQPLLRHRPSEVIINLMFEHINRFLDDKRAKIRDSYAMPFGPNWRIRLDTLQASGLCREEAVLELFREHVKDVGGYDYVLSARIKRPTAERSHFYLVYGTRHPKGLIEFRKVEDKAKAAEEMTRIEAKQEKRVARSGQLELIPDLPRPVTELRQPQIDKARSWLREQLLRSQPLSYVEVMVGVLERFSVTEKDLKDLLVALSNGNQIGLHGMRPRQHKPKDGVTISLGTSPWPEPLRGG